MVTNDKTQASAPFSFFPATLKHRFRSRSVGLAYAGPGKLTTSGADVRPFSWEIRATGPHFVPCR